MGCESVIVKSLNGVGKCHRGVVKWGMYISDLMGECYCVVNKSGRLNGESSIVLNK